MRRAHDNEEVSPSALAAGVALEAGEIARVAALVGTRRFAALCGAAAGHRGRYGQDGAEAGVFGDGRLAPKRACHAADEADAGAGGGKRTGRPAGLLVRRTAPSSSRFPTPAGLRALGSLHPIRRERHGRPDFIATSARKAATSASFVTGRVRSPMSRSWTSCAPTSSASDERGFWTATTLKPFACSNGMTGFHIDPSQNAP